MAREEADREDLLGEATAYVERIEWKLAEPVASEGSVFAGFRSDGAPSFYFGPDPVYHFNASGELRRAFTGGQLIKAERGLLVCMQRVRSEDEVSLVSTDLSPEQTAAFCLQVTRHLGLLLTALQNHRASITGQFPENVPIDQRVIGWLESHAEIVIARNPRAGG